jgi:hypothetical protein
MFHPPLERLGLLLPTPALQGRVVLAHDHRTMPLVLPQTLGSPGTFVTLRAKLKTVMHSAGRFLHQPTALRVDFARRTNRAAFFDLDVKVFHREPAFFTGGRLRRPN